jgi:hypothetical protein
LLFHNSKAQKAPIKAGGFSFRKSTTPKNNFGLLQSAKWHENLAKTKNRTYEMGKPPLAFYYLLYSTFINFVRCQAKVINS